MKSMMKKTTLREIRQSFGRWFAIFAIVALGVGFFTGLKVTKQAMLATEYKYLKEQNMFDVRLLSTLGFTEEDVTEIGKAEGVVKAAGGYELDALCSNGEENEYVLKAHSLTEGINTPVLKNRKNA
jgi:putative ABC transport system permease protein